MEKIKYFFKEFLPQVASEWKKVTKPSRHEVMTTTAVVVITSFVFAIYLWLADTAIQWTYKTVFKALGL
jgi:preprotein translocase SecE subunit